MKADRNWIGKPNLPRSETFNGENVASNIGNGSFDIMANGPTGDGFDASLYLEWPEEVSNML